MTMDTRIIDAKHNDDGTVTLTVGRDAFRMLGNAIPVIADWWYDKSRDDDVTVTQTEREVNHTIFENYMAIDNRMRELRLTLGI